MAKKNKPKVSVDEARKIVQAHMDAEQEQRRRENERYIGRCFKYLNRYSDGEPWWLYGIVTRVDEWGHPWGMRFQHTTNGNLEIERDCTMSGVLHGNNGGWSEIKPVEFWRKAQSFEVAVGLALKRRELSR